MLRRQLVLLTACTAVLLSQRQSSRRVSPATWSRAFIAIATPVELNLDLPTQLIYVNPSAIGADDGNPGSQELPLRTISAATALVRSINRAQLAARILVSPGTYREQVAFTGDDRATSAPITLEATEPGRVILSGSDEWRDWEQTGPSTYTHVWQYRWGLAPYPNGWLNQVQLPPIVRRREMIFVDGSPLRQVLTAEELEDSSFYVDEAGATVTVRLKTGATLDHARVEVASRPLLLSLQNTHNWLLRGITFQHGNAAIQDGAVRIADSENILVENCTFVWNNWVGLTVSGVTGMTLRRSRANANGGTGVDGYQLRNLYVEGTDTSFNNWRGAQGQFYGWSVAGAKFTAVHGASIRSHTARSNTARGLWMDYDNKDILIEQSSFEKNANDGLFLEANTGPIKVLSSSFVGNFQGSGILGANTQDVVISDCTISGNSVAQLSISGDYKRTVSNWITGATDEVFAQRWALERNLLVSTDPSQMLLITPDWIPFLSTYQGTQNRWQEVGASPTFQMGGGKLSFQEWQALVSSDFDSQVVF